MAKGQILDYAQELEIGELAYVYMDLAVEIHNSVIEKTNKQFKEAKRQIFVEPIMFIDMVNKFKDLFTVKRKEIDDQIIRLRKGVKAIMEARTQVIEIESYLRELKP